VNNKYSVFTHGDGLIVLDELIQLFHTSFPFDKDSATQTAFNLGQQDVVNYILSKIKETEVTIE